jgi:hypothetical protein
MSRMESRVQKLEAALRDAGLAGRVRVGVPLEHPVQPNDFRSPDGGAPPLSLDFLLSPEGRRGHLIEVAGGLSSGRTALACRIAAGTTARGLVGWVDLPNTLDPRSLRRAGADLHSLLWARPRGVTEALRCGELLLQTGFALVVIDLQGAPPSRLARLAPPVWTRLLRRVQGARATAVVLVPERVAGSFPTLGLWTERRRALFEGVLFEGIETCATVVRDRTGPVGAEHPFRILQRPEVVRHPGTVREGGQGTHAVACRPARRALLAGTPERPSP